MATTQRLGIDIVATDKTAKGFSAVQRQMRDMTRAAGMVKGVLAGMFAGLTVAGVGAALKSQIDHLDDLGKAAQKIGIPVEELSKLEYAARLADVPLEGLTSSMGKFAKAISEVGAGGKNDAGKALAAMGISATDANGKLRPTADILADVADEFSVYRDGANKTALAMALFGKAGADMIPLLNGGRAAIAGAGAELQSFGGVVTPQAAAAAEQFNDNLTRLQTAGQGVVQIMTQQLLPVLVDLTNKFVDLVKNGDLVNSFFARLGDIIAADSADIAKFGALSAAAMDIWNNPQGPTAALERWQKAFGEIGAINDQLAKSKNAGNISQFDLMTGNTGTQTGSGKGDLPSNINASGKLFGVAPALAVEAKKVKTGVDEAAKALDKLKAAGQATWESTRTPIENYQLEIRKLNDQLSAGVIDHDTYARAVKNLQDGFSDASASIADDAQGMQQMMDQVSGDLASGFSNAISGMIDGTQSFKSAIKSMVSDVVGNLSSMFLNKAFSGLFNVGGSSGLGSLFGGFSGLYANGGSIPSGKWGIAGEAGPELITGPATVIPARDMGARSSGGGTMNININLAGANGDAAIQAATQRGIRSALGEYDRTQPKRDLERSLRVR